MGACFKPPPAPDSGPPTPEQYNCPECQAILQLQCSDDLVATLRDRENSDIEEIVPEEFLHLIRSRRRSNRKRERAKKIIVDFIAKNPKKFHVLVATITDGGIKKMLEGSYQKAKKEKQAQEMQQADQDDTAEQPPVEATEPAGNSSAATDTYDARCPTHKTQSIQAPFLFPNHQDDAAHVAAKSNTDSEEENSELSVPCSGESSDEKPSDKVQESVPVAGSAVLHNDQKVSALSA